MKQSLTIETLGQYDIVREVGRGAMGIVFEAVDRKNQEHVAVKAFPWHLTSGTHWKRRFEEEARTAGRLRHKNIVPVLGFGEQGGFCYYVMRYIDGVSLDWIIHKLCSEDAVVYAHEIASLRPGDVSQPKPSVKPQDSDSAGTGRSRSLRRNEWRKIATIGLQVAEALQAAHRAGTVHRDIKPANLLLDTSGKVWVTDFGLAAALHPDTTDSGMSVAGTVRYMAPELFLGHRFDERSDVYSLGATLYELATLTPTFTGEDRMQMVQRIVREGPELPRTVCPEIPVDFERIIRNAMHRDPQVRYANAAQLITDLLRFLNGQSVQFRRLSMSQRLFRWLRLSQHPLTTQIEFSPESLPEGNSRPIEGHPRTH